MQKGLIMDAKQIEKASRILLVNKINEIAEKYGFYVQYSSTKTFWVVFDESENFKRHVFIFRLTEYTMSCFLNVLRNYMEKEINSDEETIFLYQRCNLTKQTLLQAYAEEKRQEELLYKFLIACHDKF